MMRRTLLLIALLLSGCATEDLPAEELAPTSAAGAPSATQRPRPSPRPTVEPTPAPTPAPTVPPTPEELRYIYPVQPPSESSFGPCHHDYPASDIFAPVGTRFVAVTSGTVDWVTYEDVWDPATDVAAVRGGLSVGFIGDDGVRYYGSHLSEIGAGIEVGARVSPGQTLGLIGISGDARFTPPHVHFGISHPTTPEDWEVRRGEINPVPYLNDWLNGVNTTPDLTTPGGGAC